MEMLRKAILVLILLGVVVLAWVGGSVYYQNSNIEVNPNAQGYTKVLRESFDLEELEKITERTNDSFPVSPSEFTVLIEGN